MTLLNKLEYINNSPDTLNFIWFHLWPNAYKNDKTAFSDQLLENRNTKFYFSDKDQRGYINRLDFKVNDATAELQDHPEYIDIVKLILPTPLAPGQKCIITTPFHEKLPFNFSRGGHDGQSYQITQWYPKPAVYDSKGWHPIPYLDQGEYYSEFGSFDVRITVPKNYVVAATGELQDEKEKEWLLSRKNYSWKLLKEKIKTKFGGIKNIIHEFPPSDKQTKTIQYKQNNVHDFAWFADKRFIVDYDTCKLASGKVIDIFTYYTPQHKNLWQNSLKFCKDAVRYYSSRIGEYPFNIVQAVQGPESFGGGMEYPTITVISPTSSLQELDITIAHEIGHNWFYGSLATNERDHPWMDEGINTYYEHGYAAMKYKDYIPQEKILFETFAKEKIDQPIETTSEKFNVMNYDLVAYFKTSEWMRFMESQLGSEAFNKAMQEYYRQWQFKHPQPEDFKKVIEESTGKNQDSVFSYLHKKGILPNEERIGSKLVVLFQHNTLFPYTHSNIKNIFLLSPVIGANGYDKLMVGGLITNYKLPPTSFQFFAAPMYATGSKHFAGIGKLNYSFFPNKTFRKIDIFLNGSTFTMNEFTDSAGKKNFYAFRKIVPGIRFTFNQKDPRSTLHSYIQFKTFFIGEDGLLFYRDTVISGVDTSIFNNYKTVKNNSTLNQLQFVVENKRVLYPYSGNLNIEQSNGFIRTTFTGKYFFNYSKGGGLDVRLFAGKFFYINPKTINEQFATDRYHLNMTGASGYEDYTYSDYFIGRNKFTGFASQQIMIRDGAFKVRTDLLADKVGKTDDWLMAANFTSSIPEKINPLNLLPVKIPLKLFADVGTYADAWKQNSNLDRFIFDAGIYLPLFRETVNIYVPLLYSQIFSDYFKSTLPGKTRFWKTISFKIDISNFHIGKFDRNLSFLDE